MAQAAVIDRARWRVEATAVGDRAHAPRPGVVARLGARALGAASGRLGAGTPHKEDAVSASAGVVCRKEPGDPVDRGDPVLELHADDPALPGPVARALAAAVETAEEPPARGPRVMEVIRS